MFDAENGPRHTRRAMLATTAAAVTVGLSGCEDAADDLQEPGDTVAYVPATASVVLDIDMAITENEETIQILEEYADEEDLLERFESRTGIDPSNIEEVLVFAEEPQLDRATLIVDGDIDEEAAAEAIESRYDTDFEATDHDTGTVYTPTDENTRDIALGLSAENQYVVGPESTVRTALDVFGDDEDALDGPLRDAFEAERETRDENDRRGFVVGATDQPRAFLPADDSDDVPSGVSLDLFEELETASGVYFVNDDGVGIDIALRAPDEDTASEVEAFTETILAYLRSEVDDQAVADEFAQINIDRNETIVTVAYRSDADGAATLVGWI